MALVETNFQALLEPKFRKVFFESYKELPEQFSRIYNILKSKKAKEYDYHVSGTGKWDIKEEAGPIAEDTINSGQEVSYRHISYAKGISVSRELADDDQYTVIEKLPRSLGRGCRVTVEEKAIGVINDGFTTVGYDGVPLFSANHPLLRDGSTTSNLLTGAALSDTSLKAGLTAMRVNTLTQEGFKMQAEAKQLIVAPDNEFTALTVLRSAQVAGTDLNDKNVLPRLTVVVMDYLDDADAWFLRDPRISETNFFWRVKPEFKSTEVFDNMVAKYRGYCRFSCGYSDWRGWVGNPGA